VYAVQGEVLRDEITLAEEMVLLDGDRPEVAVNRSQDPPETLAALKPGRVIDHVGSDEFVEHRVIAVLLGPEQLSDDVFRTSFAHAASPFNSSDKAGVW